MRNLAIKILIGILGGFLLFFAGNNILAAASSSSTTTATLLVYEECNNNGVCDTDLGEDETFCFNDCGCNNNGVCETARLETETNCLADCGVAPEPEKEGNGGEYTMYVADLKISNITFDSAELSWQTTRNTKCVISLGKTADYEVETISETNFSESHSLKFYDLDVSTEYHFNIVCSDEGVLKAESGDKFFVTLSAINNVGNFVATAGESDIKLTWKNPASVDFAGVVVVRSSEFYPLSIANGEIVYSGTGESFTDSNVELGKDYYYVIFAKSQNGRVSSGMVAQAKIEAKTQAEPATPIASEQESGTAAQVESPEISATAVGSSEKVLKLIDFDFYSNSQKVSITGKKTINLQAGEDFIISIGASKVPSSHKTMIAKVNFGGKSQSYIFTLNSTGTVWSASSTAPQDAGSYTLTISFYSQTNNFLYSIDGELDVLLGETATTKTCMIWIITWMQTWLNWWWILLIILIILLLLILLILLDRDKKKKQNA